MFLKFHAAQSCIIRFLYYFPVLSINVVVVGGN